MSRRSVDRSLVARALDRVDPRGLRHWGGGWFASRVLREAPDPTRPVHVYVCVADHFEPNHRRPGLDEQRRRVDAWVTRFPAMARRHRDATGRAHVRTFFFPVEEYRPEFLDALASLRRDGFGDVEVHLHHENDTADNLRRTLADFARTLSDGHGLLRREPRDGRIEYAFIHGNWALDNSHPERRFCGVDNELAVLAETGCYLDMTLPSAPSPTQTRTVNSIYYARGRDGAAKSHDRGVEVCVGGHPPSSAHPPLMLIQGPLAPNVRARRFGLIPRIETGELSPDNATDPAARVAVQVQHAPAVRGAPNHRFVKLHAHGTQPGGERYFLTPGEGYDRLLDVYEREYNDGRRFVLHYVTAREMFDTVRGLERGAIAP
jgi:hypothetical protein